jgi:hypothetical protein
VCILGGRDGCGEKLRVDEDVGCWGWEQPECGACDGQ